MHTLRRFLPLALVLLVAGFTAAPSWSHPEHSEFEPHETPPVEPPDPIVPREGEPFGFDTDPDAAPAETSESSGVSVVSARLVDQRPGHRWVRSVQRVRKEVGRFEWSRQGDRLVYDAPTDRGVRGLHVADIGLDKSGGAVLDFEQCVTCEHWEFRKSHVLSPTWHPSGRWIVAMVQGPATKLDLDTPKLATPARGLHSDLWVFAPNGRDIWQLTRVVEQGGAILDPRFSFEGDHLAWTQRIKSRVGRWGAWSVFVGEFQATRRGVPRLGKVREIELPRASWASVHAFTEDDRGLWVTLGPPAGERGSSIARVDLDSGETTVLDPLGTLDALPSNIPRTDRRVLASNRDVPPSRRGLAGRNDLWLESASGFRRERLTFFNHPAVDTLIQGAPAEVAITDTSWSPAGNELLLQVLSPGASGIEESLWIVTFDPAIREGGGTP